MPSLRAILSGIPVIRKLFPENSGTEEFHGVEEKEKSGVSGEEALLFEDSPEREEEDNSRKEGQPFREEEKKGNSLKKILLLGVSLIALLLLGGVSWKVGRNFLRDPLGPSLENLSVKEESLYCPLGFPLLEKNLFSEFQALGIVFSRNPEGNYEGVSKVLKVLIRSGDTGVAPLSLTVEDPRISVKWGLGVGTSEEALLDFLGNPRERSGDLLVYGDLWGNLLLYEMSGDAVSRVELRYPEGLLLEK